MISRKVLVTFFGNSYDGDICYGITTMGCMLYLDDMEILKGAIDKYIADKDTEGACDMAFKEILPLLEVIFSEVRRPNPSSDVIKIEWVPISEENEEW